MYAPHSRVAAVVVTHDRPEDLRCCVAALLGQTYPIACVIVVDNGGPSLAKDILEPCDRLRIVRIPINVGGAGGFSLGVQAALENEFDWIWLLDDDAIAEPEALQCLLSQFHSQSGERPAVLLSAVYEFGQIAVRHRRVFDRWTGLEWPISEQRYRELRVPVDTGSFVGFLIRAEAARSIPPPRADFFLAFEDTEYSLRLQAQGHRLFLVPSSRIDHLRNRKSRLRKGPWSGKHYLNIRNHLVIKRVHARIPVVGVAVGLIYGILVWAVAGGVGSIRSFKQLLLAFRNGVRGRLGPPPVYFNWNPNPNEEEHEGLCVLIRTQGRRPKLLAEAIDSALRQEGSVRVKVLVHGDSVAYTEVRSGLENLSQLSIEVVHVPDHLGSRAHPLNVALRQLYDGNDHPYGVAFLDDDDILYPDFSRVFIGMLRRSGADVVYAGSNLQEADGAVRSAYLPLPATCLLVENFIPINSYVVRFASLKGALVFFEEELEVLEDWSFLQRLLCLGFDFCPLPGVFSEFRMTGDGNSPRKNDQHLWDRAWDRVHRDLDKLSPSFDGLALLDVITRFDFGIRSPLSEHERNLVKKTLERLEAYCPVVAQRPDFKKFAIMFS